ncbi:MAG: hypothetical protein V3V19_11215 [Cocleimonas sp.]
MVNTNKDYIQTDAADTAEFVLEYVEEGEWTSIEEYELDGISSLLAPSDYRRSYEIELEKIDKWKLKMAGLYDKKYNKQIVKRFTSKAYYSQLIKC